MNKNFGKMNFGFCLVQFKESSSLRLFYSKRFFNDKMKNWRACYLENRQSHYNFKYELQLINSKINYSKLT